MKLNLIKTYSGQLIALYDSDYDILKTIPKNKAFCVSPNFIRDPVIHRKFFALIKKTWDYINSDVKEDLYHNSIDSFRQDIEITAGYFKRVYSHRHKDYLEFPKSIAYSELDELEFKQIYWNVREVIFSLYLKDMPDEEFHKHFESFYY